MESYHLRYSKGSKKLRYHSTKLKRFILMICACLLIVPSATYAYLSLRKSLPALMPAISKHTLADQTTIKLPWPAAGQAAIGSSTQGVLAQSTIAETPVPTASIAKVITALAVLNKVPIAAGSQGATITLSSPDVALYEHYVAIGGSNVRVEDGEQISEYQALEAMLLPSANNMADSLAVWAFGSMDAYTAYAAILMQQWGLNKTTVSDASGFSPATQSTPSELVKIGQRALMSPVIKTIVGLKQADIPVAGTIQNVNQLLGNNDVIGIKTGNTNEAGGCLLFAANKTIAPGQTTIIIGAVQGAPNLDAAFTASKDLLAAAQTGFAAITVARAGEAYGTLTAPWGQSTAATAQNDVIVYGWKDTQLPLTPIVRSTQAPVVKGQAIGELTVTFADTTYRTPLIAKTGLGTASNFWRLKHYL